MAASPIALSEMDEKHGAGQWSGLPCFCVTQASGKSRRIDNGKTSHTNKATGYSEKFSMNTAFAPAISAGALGAAVKELGAQSVLKFIRDLESGGEDIPDAFRTIPSLAAHLRHNIVLATDPSSGKLMAVQVYAALFGEGSSVFGFARWSAFLEAAPRRMLFLLWSMYVDDGRLIDCKSAKGRGQHLVNELFKELGCPSRPPSTRQWRRRLTSWALSTTSASCR